MSRIKIECARRQLGMALDLYLRDLDPISVHCLANGGCELIEFYAQQAGNSFTSHILRTQPHLDIKDVKRLQRQYWNAFKHATKPHGGEERKDDDLLSRFTDKQNDTALMVGWADYYRVTKTMPIEAQVHQVWWIALNPEKLDPKHASDLVEYQKLFVRLGELPRQEQKAMLNKVIEWARSQKDVMSDPHTDTRPLILGWG